MLGRSDRRGRLLALLVCLTLLATLIGARLAYWQVVRAADLRETALAQLQRSTREPAQRGEIHDRSGSVVLATTAYRDLLAAYPSHIPVKDRPAVADRLITILRLSGDAAKRLRASIVSERSYAVLSRQLTPAQSAAIQTGLDDRTLSGLELDPQALRVYPNPGGAPDTTLASSLLGFVDSSGEGQYGVEQRYQGALAGRPRLVSALRDASGRAIVDSRQILDPGSPGTDLQLTIDASLQLLLEKELYAAWVADGAASASAVILEPRTGEVLAWGTVPGYDANDYERTAVRSAERFADPLVSRVYEPGSVMKMFVAAKGYESKAFDATTLIDDTGSIRIGRLRVDDSDKKAMGRIPFQDVIAYSRNVGSARAVTKLGKDTDAAAASLYDIWRRLGIGQTTGVDVAGELPGLAVDPARERWQPIDLANRSFGQGMAVTPLQLAASFSAMVNGGYRVQPHVVAAVGGQAVEQRPAVSVISSALSDELRRLLLHVVTRVPWYAAGTLIPGYTVGGKTGTAQIWDTKHHRWLPNTFNFSFVGFLGGPMPDAVIAVQIRAAKPHIRGQGDFQLGITSYELFRRLARDTISVLDIPPDATPRRAGPAVP